MIETWIADLERRYLADLTFSEVVRALRALSSNYVERRDRLSRRSALDTAGKRAAYAMYYHPLHFLTIRHIVHELGLAATPVRHILDAGCGAGAAGAAWASQLAPPAAVTGLDTHPWALREALVTYRTFAVRGETRQGDAARTPFPQSVDAVVAGWMVNELDDAARDAMLRQLLRAAEHGARVLVVEPIATRVSPWWKTWVEAFRTARARKDQCREDLCREDLWRIRADLPDIVMRLGHAAALRPEELTARSLCAGV